VNDTFTVLVEMANKTNPSCVQVKITEFTTSQEDLPN